eukprot:CAMPEP_0170480996 /NCGR_PEP_ID=MMETSP0208-20121228/1611_1 /TAXON_ID=197538 /ORGANISM="Strombidium inclinatum, Strain S3" /LENGTH=274 /DNA_ID=CAMNT_0010753623 /DNA_START=11 /DNA_END=832 /DNA_ORIENTATION=-
MELPYVQDLPKGGFSYDNCLRNKALTESNTLKAGPIRHMKTGTTICAAIFKDGVVMAADPRATGGSIVGDKNCEKIHYMAPNIRVCGAGTAADCDHVSEMLRRELEIHRFNTRTENRVQMLVGKLASKSFQYQGHLGTHLIIGGVDVKGPQLFEVSNDGNYFAFPFITMGSGCLAAMAIMETQYKEDMTEEECKNMCIAAIEAGIYNDLGSGSNVDCCVIKKGKVDMYRNIKHDNKKVYSKPGGYKFDKDRVQVLNEYKMKLVVEDGAQPMDLS